MAGQNQAFPRGIIVDGVRYWRVRDIAEYTGHQHTSLGRVLARARGAIDPVTVDPKHLERRDQKLYPADEVVAYFSPEAVAARAARSGFGSSGIDTSIPERLRASAEQRAALTGNVVWPDDAATPTVNGQPVAVRPLRGLLQRGAIERDANGRIVITPLGLEILAAG